MVDSHSRDKVVAPGNANDAKVLKSAGLHNTVITTKALYGKKEEVTQDPYFYDSTWKKVKSSVKEQTYYRYLWSYVERS